MTVTFGILSPALSICLVDHLLSWALLPNIMNSVIVVLILSLFHDWFFVVFILSSFHEWFLGTITLLVRCEGIVLWTVARFHRSRATAQNTIIDNVRQLVDCSQIRNSCFITWSMTPEQARKTVKAIDRFDCVYQHYLNINNYTGSSSYI